MRTGSSSTSAASVFRVAVPASTAAALPGAGEEVTLHIHTHVREDTLALYGFASEEELRLFEEIISVSGMGPKSGHDELVHVASGGVSPRDFRRRCRPR